MAAYISIKSSWLRFFASLLPAIGIAVLLCILLDGPRLGPFYDFLLKLRPAFPISKEILIIDSSSGDDILEPGAAASLLNTMAELGAGKLIIQVPILGLSVGGSAGEEEILNRFDEEFSILSRNIRNLFDAIRTGSVVPNEAARYVGELVELSEKGKERLVSALVLRDEAGIAGMEEAAAFFGRAWRPGDLQVQLIRAGGASSANQGYALGEAVVAGRSEAERPGALVERGEYSKAQPDRDGVLRRIMPVMTAPRLSEEGGGERSYEHVVYAALKSGFNYSEIQLSRTNLVLVIRNGPNDENRIIPLDRYGAVLFEIPRKGGDFRRIGISDFLAYDEADRSLRRLLLEGEALGIFQDLEGENNPGILYDYALSIREEAALAFGSGNEEKKPAWIEARKRYFSSLNDFLSGPAEVNLVMGYEEIIASESSDLIEADFNSGNNFSETIDKMIEMRNSLIVAFAVIRAKHGEVLELRERLENALNSSFCILGNTRDVEASALLANSLLTGNVVKPGEKRYLLLGALLSILLTCFFIKSQGPTATLGAGALFTLFFTLSFSFIFILSGYWFDPLVPASACTAAFFFSFIWTLIAKLRYSRRFSLAYGPFVSHSCLKSVIDAGRPLPSQAVTIRAAIVAIKNSEPLADSPGQRAKAALSFQQSISDLARKAGGTIVGFEEDLASVSFGSPLERVFLKAMKESPYEGNINANAAPALKAVDFVFEITKRPDCKKWLFGLDMGNCTFAWTALSGYFALGIPVQKAKILSRLADRYKSHIVISAAVNETLSDLAVKKLDVLKGKDGTIDEPFYRLVV